MCKRSITCVIVALLGLNYVACKPSPETTDQQSSTSASTPSTTVATPTTQNDPASSEVWLNAWHRATPTIRDSMAEKIVSEGSLLGKTEDEVVALLGKPDFRSERLVYSFVVSESGENTPAPSLTLNLDCDGQVVTAGPTSFPSDITPDPFDEQRWQNGTDHDRFLMTPALAKSHRLKGMSRDAAIRLLGEPTQRTLPRIAYYSRRRIEGKPVPTGPNRKLLIIFNESFQVNKVVYTKK